MQEPQQQPEPKPRRGGPWRRALRMVGAAIYQLTIRLAVNVAIAVLFLYFAINSAAVASRISAFASDQVPGTITTRHIQWGPDPGQLRLIRPVVKDAEGHLVIAAEWMSVGVSWLGMVQQALAGKGLRAIRIRQVVIAGPRVALETNEAGQLRLALAFVTPSDEPEKATPPGAPLALIIDAITVKAGHFLMDLSGTRIDAAGIEMEADFRLQLSGEQAGSYAYNGRAISAKRMAMWLQSFETAGLAQLPASQISVARVSGDQHGVRCLGTTSTAPHTRITRGDVVVRLDAPGPTPGTFGVDVKVTDTAIATSTTEPFVARLLGPTFAAKAEMIGSVSVGTNGATHVEVGVTGAGKMAGFQTRSVSTLVMVDVGDRADEIVRVRAEKLHIQAFGGDLRSKEVRYRLGKDGEQRVTGHVQLKGVSVAEALTSEAVGMTTAGAAAMAGVLDGELETDVKLRIDGDKKPPLSMVAKVGGLLTLRRAEGATLLREALPTLHLRGQIDTIMSPHGEPPRPLTIELGQVLISDQADAAGVPKRAAKATWIFADGEVDLHRARVELRLDANLPDLARLLLPFGVKGVGGSARLDDVGVKGPWLNPEIAGGLDARQLVAGGQQIKRLKTRLALSDGVLKLTGLRAEVALGQAAGDLELDLYERDLTKLRKHMQLRGARVRVSGVDLAGLLKPYKIDYLKGELDLSRVSFELDLSDPLKTVDARAHLHITRPVLRHERLKRLDADVRFGGGRVDVRKLEMEYQPIALAGLAPNVKAPTVTVERLTYGLDTQRFELTGLTWPRMALSRIGEVAALKMPLHGTIAMTVKEAKGSATDLSFDAAMSFTGLAWDKIFMGSADVAIRKNPGKPAVVTSERFFDRFELMGGSRVHFTRIVPTWMQFNLKTARLDPMAFLGLPPMSDLRMLATGKAEFRLDFRPGHDVFTVHTELPKGGAELELGNGLEPISNLHPATIDIFPDRVKIGSMSLPFGRDILEMCGEFVFPNEAKGVPSILRMYLAGTLDVPRFGALAESMAALDMRLRIDKDPLVELDKRSRCLTTAAAQGGIMRLAGPLDALAAQGQLRLLQSRMTPRGYGKEVVLAEGAQLELSTLAKGRLRVRIPVDSRLQGQIEESTFSTWGTLHVIGYTPQDVDWHFEAVDLAHTVPKEYSVVMSTQLRLLGDRLADEKRRNLKLSGKITVTEGSYSKSFDRLGKVISGVRGRELEAYSEPLMERMPWIGRIGMDLKVNGSNFLVLSRFPFGKTDLELSMDLRVRGTFAQPKIYDRVVIEPGSILTYSVVKRDFEVTRGTIDFRGDPAKGVLDLEAKDDVEVNNTDSASASTTMSVGPNLSGTSSSGYAQIVTVIIRVSGPLDDPSKLVIDFSSVPPYQQGDIQSLILTGQLLTSSSASGSLGSRASINLLTDDLAQAFSDMLLSAFVDKVTIGIPVAGGVSATVTTKLGKYLTLRGEYKSQPGVREMIGRFAFNLPLESLYLESLLLSREVDSNNALNTNIFEGRIRYRLTLED